MNSEQQRIAIAEACGWRIKLSDLQSGLDVYRDNEPYCKPLPDYLNDLNAMHEAEKVLDDVQIDLFKNYLHVVVTTKERITAHATAAQRAEAFLKVVNKWKD